MADEKELQQLKKRLAELAKRSFDHDIYTFTGFLGMSEQQVYYEMQKELAYAGASLFGGCAISERRMVRFGIPENLGYEEEFPIVCIKIEPLSVKFAEHLTHRDFLGALMNLGIERSTIGDIFVQEKEAYVFCVTGIQDFIVEQLVQIKHTKVHCYTANLPECLQNPEPETVTVSAASERIDGIVSKLYNIARSESLSLFQAGRVFVNGRLMENNSYTLKEKDAVTVRGFGKFVFAGRQGETRKGKLRITLSVFR